MIPKLLKNDLFLSYTHTISKPVMYFGGRELNHRLKCIPLSKAAEAVVSPRLISLRDAARQVVKTNE